MAPPTILSVLLGNSALRPLTSNLILKEEDMIIRDHFHCLHEQWKLG